MSPKTNKRMKKIIVALFITLSVIACKKDPGVTPTPIPPDPNPKPAVYTRPVLSSQIAIDNFAGGVFDLVSKQTPKSVAATKLGNLITVQNLDKTKPMLLLQDVVAMDSLAFLDKNLIAKEVSADKLNFVAKVDGLNVLGGLLQAKVQENSKKYQYYELFPAADGLSGIVSRYYTILQDNGRLDQITSTLVRLKPQTGSGRVAFEVISPEQLTPDEHKRTGR